MWRWHSSWFLWSCTALRVRRHLPGPYPPLQHAAPARADNGVDRRSTQPRKEPVRPGALRFPENGRSLERNDFELWRRCHCCMRRPRRQRVAQRLAIMALLQQVPLRSAGPRTAQQCGSCAGRAAALTLLRAQQLLQRSCKVLQALTVSQRSARCCSLTVLQQAPRSAVAAASAVSARSAVAAALCLRHRSANASAL